MPEIRVVNFSLAGEEYAIDIMRVDSVSENIPTTKIPGMPFYMEGIINLRGEVIPIINLRKKFNIDDYDESWKEKAKIIIIYRNGRKVGLLVDEVKEVTSLDQEQIEDKDSVGSNIGEDFISGIARKGDRMIILLDVDKIVGEEVMKI